MNRREFLKTSLAGACAATVLAHDAPSAEAQERVRRDYYELRTYHLRPGARQNGVAEFYAAAAIPALRRAGTGPVGLFEPVKPDEADPQLFVLIPHPSLDSVFTVQAKLAADRAFMRDGAAFLGLPASDPGYVRFESSLMRAFDVWPTLKKQDAARQRIFELRCYESPTERAHAAKVRMFNSGEVPIFLRTGLQPVFFGQTLVGSKLPNLIYMVEFADMPAHDRAWAAFGADPEWKELSKRPGLGDIAVVNHITSTMLKPAIGSEI